MRELVRPNVAWLMGQNSKQTVARQMIKGNRTSLSALQGARREVSSRKRVTIQSQGPLVGELVSGGELFVPEDPKRELKHAQRQIAEQVNKIAKGVVRLSPEDVTGDNVDEFCRVLRAQFQPGKFVNSTSLNTLRVFEEFITHLKNTVSAQLPRTAEVPKVSFMLSVAPELHGKGCLFISVRDAIEWMLGLMQKHDPVKAGCLDGEIHLQNCGSVAQALFGAYCIHLRECHGPEISLESHTDLLRLKENLKVAVAMIAHKCNRNVDQGTPSKVVRTTSLELKESTDLRSAWDAAMTVYRFVVTCRPTLPELDQHTLAELLDAYLQCDLATASEAVIAAAELLLTAQKARSFT